MHITTNCRRKHGPQPTAENTPSRLRKRARDLRRYYERDDHESWAASTLSNARRRAKNRGLEFHLTRQDLLKLARNTSHCAILGTELHYARGLGDGPRPDAASIDRIDNERGYHLDNIRIVSLRANAMKNNLTMDQLINLAMYCLDQAKRRK